MTPVDDDKTKKALIGAAQTIARAADAPLGDLADLADGDTIHSGATTSPPQVSDAAAQLDDAGERYQRTVLLGEGGMGKVWQVSDARVGRRVAMKVVRAESASDDGTRARFLREARVQGQLEHPAVVPVYDLGRSPDGELFFTMKRVRGVTLSDVIVKLGEGDAATVERFSTRRLLSAFSQVCLAVQYAHERGVLHRDLKPDNLMLGDHGEVYVLDWGVARILRDDLELGGHALTPEELKALAGAGNQTGLVGTPGYLAPEQLRGQAIGPTADVYALGAILFELLTLRPLAGDGNVLSRLERTITGVDAAAVIASLDRDVPAELVALCARATANDPAERIPSARAMVEAIERHLDGERDLQMRRELAERHLGLARASIDAHADELEAHKRALRETGRALAIMPDHPDARRMILQLFASTPSTSPPQVEEAIEAERAHQSRLTAKTSAAGMASMLFFLPVLMFFGIRNWLGIATFMAMTVVAVIISAIAARRQKRSATLLYMLVLANNLVFGLCAGMYGPLVLVPTMVITNTITFALHLEGWPRRVAVGSGCLAILVPVLLSAAGVFPPSYVPMGEGILMRPLWLSFPPTWTLAFLVVSMLIAVVNGAVSVAQVRAALTEAERRNQMQRWQLQQLLPEEHDASGPIERV